MQAVAESGFLSDAALERLTGRRQKSKQIEWLRSEGIPFHVNATGHPAVTWTAVDGRREVATPAKVAWMPRVLGG